LQDEFRLSSHEWEVRENYNKMVYCIEKCGTGGTEMFGSPKFACRGSAFAHRTYMLAG
jgi:hypothetical protein